MCSSINMEITHPKNWKLFFSMVRKKFFEKNYMLKMCFKTHRIQKIYLKINFFFSSTIEKTTKFHPPNFHSGWKKKLFLNIFLDSMGLRTHFNHVIFFKKLFSNHQKNYQVPISQFSLWIRRKFIYKYFFRFYGP